MRREKKLLRRRNVTKKYGKSLGKQIEKLILRLRNLKRNIKLQSAFLGVRKLQRLKYVRLRRRRLRKFESRLISRFKRRLTINCEKN
jgi:hypothetical protein